MDGCRKDEKKKSQNCFSFFSILLFFLFPRLILRFEFAFLRSYGTRSIFAFASVFLSFLFSFLSVLHLFCLFCIPVSLSLSLFLSFPLFCFSFCLYSFYSILSGFSVFLLFVSFSLFCLSLSSVFVSFLSFSFLNFVLYYFILSVVFCHSVYLYFSYYLLPVYLFRGNNMNSFPRNEGFFLLPQSNTFSILFSPQNNYAIKFCFVMLYFTISRTF